MDKSFIYLFLDWKLTQSKDPSFIKTTRRVFLSHYSVLFAYLDNIDNVIKSTILHFDVIEYEKVVQGRTGGN